MLSHKSYQEASMGLAEYMIVAPGDEWGVLPMAMSIRYSRKEGALESEVTAASMAIREGPEVHISVPDNLTGNRTVLGAKNNSNEEDWWRYGVFYQVYPRSFQDSDGDGVGDVGGIIQRLPYLKSLGIDAVWLSPIFPSPMADFGYDISDYKDIDPLFGTIHDFDGLVETAHENDLKLSLIWCRTTHPTGIPGLPRAGHPAKIRSVTGTSGATAR
jgi:hypothetical protein